MPTTASGETNGEGGVTSEHGDAVLGQGGLAGGDGLATRLLRRQDHLAKDAVNSRSVSGKRRMASCLSGQANPMTAHLHSPSGYNLSHSESCQWACPSKQTITGA